MCQARPLAATTVAVTASPVFVKIPVHGCGIAALAAAAADDA